MKKNLLKLGAMISLLCLTALPLAATIEGKADVNGIQLWYETFGSSKNPAFLLIMGGACQGVLWPVPFCEKLASGGFYVIRYDHRDTGLSSCLNFSENPYDLMDVSKDAVGLLDHLDIQKAHLFGLSMGGIIAQMMATHFPERVHTIAVIGSTCDVRPMNLALQDQPAEEGSLSSPVKEYSSWRGTDPKEPYDQDLEHLDYRLAIWHNLSGFASPFDEDHFRSLILETLVRLKHPESFPNHYLASARSEEMIRESVAKIQVPTLIFQGTEDPVFGPDHGEALKRAIPTAEYILMQGMGHVPTPYFEEFILSKLKQVEPRGANND